MPLRLAVRIIDVDLHQEAVELRFGQRIGAFLLQRVLRREHMERRRQVVARARDRDVMLLHRLQQRGLRARAGAVDLVGHQKLREHRTRQMKRKIALAARRLLQHFGAENVGGHQVGRELDAARVEPERDAHRLDQLGLGEARHADQQRVAAGEDRDQRAVDHALLAEDHGADRGAGGARVRGRRLGGAHHHVLEFLEPFARDRHDSLLLFFVSFGRRPVKSRSARKLCKHRAITVARIRPDSRLSL